MITLAPQSNPTDDVADRAAQHGLEFLRGMGYVIDHGFGFALWGSAWLFLAIDRGIRSASRHTARQIRDRKEERLCQ